MILSVGLEHYPDVAQQLAASFDLQPVEDIERAIEDNRLAKASLFLVGPGTKRPVAIVQQIFSADKHLSVVVLVEPASISPVKQAFLFSPAIGKNTIVVALNAELDIIAICDSAFTRTRQKRSFFKLRLNDTSQAKPPITVSPSHFGDFLEYAPVATLLITDTDQVAAFNREAKKLILTLERTNPSLEQHFNEYETHRLKEFIHSSPNPDTCLLFSYGQRFFELTSSEVYSETGQRHFLLMFKDVTIQKRESQRIQSILESLPQMAWTTATDGNATYFNQGWYFYTGQSPETALGTGWTATIHPADLSTMLQHWQSSVSHSKPFQHACRYKKADGEYRWHLTRATAIRNTSNEISMWVGTCTDIHDQVMLTEELEKKVKERTHSLEVSKSELEQFAHISSHDLQEPLRKIKTFAELLKEQVYESIDTDSQRYLDKISATAERMSSSLKSLLSYTKLHREEKFLQVDLNEAVAHVLQDLELLIIQKKATINVGSLPVIKAIPIQLQQLFYNLINNALKFARRDEPPVVSISSRLVPEEELLEFPTLNRFSLYHEIVVKDNGIGFEQKYAGKIFEMFQRLHSKAQYEGTGIGLSLVKKVITNHGGEIFALSEPGHGTAFHIILPE